MPPVRLLFDARMALHGGIGTYIRHLLEALGRSGAVEHGCVAGLPSGAPLTLPSTFCRQPFHAPIYSVLEQLIVPASPHAAPLWHSPHYNIPLRWRGALVVTVHDLIHLVSPRYARSRWATPYTAFMLRQIAARADAIIAVSEATKQALCARTGLDPARVRVIPHGVDPAAGVPVAEAVSTSVWQRYQIRPPYLLWVSAVRPHKNPLTALRAFARLQQRHAIPHQLVMVGEIPSWYALPQQEARRLQLDTAIRWTGAVSRDDLMALYQSASVLLMPSYVEGFGLPVLEAMAAGCPVLVSSIPALSELVENDDVMISPDDVDGWSDRLYNVLFNEELRRTLQARGRQRARQFTWERSAAEHLDVYRTALQ
ncbi:MAG: glycosyltransferase family 4 protein [Candidatus Omnitrophica bacterium]|nr:glycosyltransferase family 4 protein [Candidatus Omnitrophota bacterium]